MLTWNYLAWTLRHAHTLSITSLDIHVNVDAITQTTMLIDTDNFPANLTRKENLSKLGAWICKRFPNECQNLTEV